MRILVAVANHPVWICFFLFLEGTLGWNLPLPGGRFIRYNEDTGVLRINLQPRLNLPKYNPCSDTEIQNYIQIRKTPLKGNGAFAIKNLEKHKFLGFYEGNVIKSREELQKQYPDFHKMNHVMSVDGGFTFLDGRQQAQTTTEFTPAHLNHADKDSWECNCMRVLSDDERVLFFTSREIQTGEELCFDYGTNYWRGRENEKI